MNSRAVISRWGALENLIHTFLAAWLKNVPSAMQVEEVRKLKISIGDYESLNPEERYTYIVDRLEDQLRVKSRRGIDRFQQLLAPFGLSGRVDEETRRDLIEMQQVRNVLVHHRGIADRRLVEACPWCGFEIDQPLTITSDILNRYHMAQHEYVHQLYDNVKEYLRGDA